MFMTDKELIRLTDYTYPSYQIKWLRDNGFTLITARRSPAPIVIPKEQEEALVLLPNA